MRRELADPREPCDNESSAEVRREVGMGSIGEDHVALKRRVAELEQRIGEERHAREVAEQEERRAIADRKTALERAEKAEGHAARWEKVAKGLERVADELGRRAERAERERDEARNAHGMACVIEVEQRTRAERAEADNAAMWDYIAHVLREVEAFGVNVQDLKRRLDPRLVDALGRPHPGVALLEEMRALRKVREMADAAVTAYFRPSSMADDVRRLKNACAAVGALKQKACDECGMVGQHKVQCGRRA